LTNLAKLATGERLSATCGIGDAKTLLSKLVHMAEEGEEVVLRRERPPLVRPVPIVAERARAKRKPGRMRGLCACSTISMSGRRAWRARSASSTDAHAPSARRVGAPAGTSIQSNMDCSPIYSDVSLYRALRERQDARS